MRRVSIAVGVAFLLAGPVLAQSSVSFKLDEHTFNQGGGPEAGVILTSAGFRITLHSVGESISATGLVSASFNLDASFAVAYPPPGEVLGLSFLASRQDLVWNPERSGGVYNLYRDSLGNLSGRDYGQCEQQSIPGPSINDSTVPSIGDGFFYLVTAENRLGEEGTKGFGSDSLTERAGTVCP